MQIIVLLKFGAKPDVFFFTNFLGNVIFLNPTVSQFIILFLAYPKPGLFFKNIPGSPEDQIVDPKTIQHLSVIVYKQDIAWPRTSSGRKRINRINQFVQLAGQPFYR